MHQTTGSPDQIYGLNPDMSSTSFRVQNPLFADQRIRYGAIYKPTQQLAVAELRKLQTMRRRVK